MYLYIFHDILSRAVVHHKDILRKDIVIIEFQISVNIWSCKLSDSHCGGKSFFNNKSYSDNNSLYMPGLCGHFH